jgi:hypothetical protein
MYREKSFPRTYKHNRMAPEAITVFLVRESRFLLCRFRRCAKADVKWAVLLSVSSVELAVVAPSTRDPGRSKVNDPTFAIHASAAERKSSAAGAAWRG